MGLLLRCFIVQFLEAVAIITEDNVILRCNKMWCTDKQHSRVWYGVKVRSRCAVFVKFLSDWFNCAVLRFRIADLLRMCNGFLRQLCGSLRFLSQNQTSAAN